MKSINKKIALILCLVCFLGTISGCNGKIEYSDAYNLYQKSSETTANGRNAASEKDFFSSQLCVASSGNINKDKVQSNLCGAAGVFHLGEKEVNYGYHLYKKMYPASTTKILTAMLALKQGKMEDVVTVSKNAVNIPSDSSTCNLKEGDKLTLEQLLYGLMMESGNDAAIAIAEYVSGSVEKFADLMNTQARELGATGSHFVNPNGLHDDNHYTTAYDLYLIFNEAVKDKRFIKLISRKSYPAVYESKNGETVDVTYLSTNAFIKNSVSKPRDVTVIGGKTGSTNDAGRCLVLLSENKDREKIISIVLDAGSSENLYHFMKKLLEEFSNL